MYTVVQSDAVENATVANALQVSHVAGLLHWVKISPRTSAGRSQMVVCLIVAAKLCNMSIAKGLRAAGGNICTTETKFVRFLIHLVGG